MPDRRRDQRTMVRVARWARRPKGPAMKQSARQAARHRRGTPAAAASRATHAACTKSRVSRWSQAAAVAPGAASTVANAGTEGRGLAAASAARTASSDVRGTHAATMAR